MHGRHIQVCINTFTCTVKYICTYVHTYVRHMYVCVYVYTRTYSIRSIEYVRIISMQFAKVIILSAHPPLQLNFIVVGAVQSQEESSLHESCF